MKKFNIFYVAIFCAILGSCGKWLDVSPEDQLKEKDLYAVSAGFHTQINGIYQTMSEASLYGRELSFGLIEVVAQTYLVKQPESPTALFQYVIAAQYDYEYERTKPLINAIWDRSYNAIANCNSVIHFATDADPDLFFDRRMERDCILGEAYALRALLHFDIMRMFAPSPKLKPEGKYVPYQKNFPTTTPQKTEVKEYVANIVKDLEKALVLTKEIDSVRYSIISTVDNRLEFKNIPSIQRFNQFRGYRLNHYAIKALLARVYLYTGDEENAMKYATEVMKLHSAGWFKYNVKSDITSSNNYKLYDDVLFALYNNFLIKNFTDINDLINETSRANYLPVNDYDGIFGADKATDYRTYQYRSISSFVRPIKYSEEANDKDAFTSNKLIPMIRLSEVYYIAAECMYDKDKAKAESYLNYVRSVRGVKTAVPTTASKSDFIKLILNDVRREQLCEGQLFFFYKRNNMPIIIKGAEVVNPLEKGFTFPIPDSNNI